MSQALFFVLLFVISVIWFTFTNRNRKRKHASLPPGNMGLPFIGETLPFLRSLVSNQPWEFFRVREAKYGKVYKTRLFGMPVVVVSPPVGTRFMFADTNHTLITKSWPVPVIKLFPESAFVRPDASGSRQLITSFLGPECMKRYVTSTSVIVQKHLDSWPTGELVRVYPLIKRCLFSIVCNMYLGLTDEKEVMELMEPFEKVIHGIISIPVNLPGTAFHRAKLGQKEICNILEKHIAKRRINSQLSPARDQDLLSMLLSTRSKEGTAMTDNEITHNILGLLVSGHELSASSISMTIKSLVENQTVYKEMKRVHCEIGSFKRPREPLEPLDLKQMKYSWRVVQESLRLRPTAPAVARKTLTDVELEGYTIPKGWQMFSAVYNSHTTPEFFPDPLKFDPSRFERAGPNPYTYFPFGGGPRICGGIEQVKMHSLVILHHITTRFDWTLMEPDEPIKISPVAVPAHGLPLELRLV
ncbi:hypothetical protein SELMODRAFT_444868 [Selaginella moellendorffii]|uniref:Uncharacterized protein CYP716N1 n=1 Tax=Selaginella moellendorffii TaxID=88036 RepID=D8SDK5_SELML|nr:cytochrome P450 716B2 [Selaginella moellendorffii]EFJ17638.1 hypothetical protein SELMODRAFT_444868 [Selaginella moellendorffii]|eukprot:XP_002981450.1 cytochrome P450 716B2 [Selaginella moellendorffii]